MKEALERWRKVYATSNLFMISTRDALLVHDTRPCAQRRWWRLAGLERLVYEYCDARHGQRAICEHFAGEATDDEIKVLLESLVHRRLLHTSRERYLSLAVPYTERSRVKHSTADVWSFLSANSTARLRAWFPLRSCNELIGALDVSRPRRWALALAAWLFLNPYGHVRGAIRRLAVARSQLPAKLRWRWARR
ncbi:MAG: hypothetical protein GY733_14470 [bacterium]|nr:hypothetical protein [bacterium]